ncbi:hypothetical protein G6F55_012346 [Rhizopus delemar]|nr:hypothetical protein G6F43_011737 [Rhizopus delemar]KAG1537520.1 hypothetical protein G6F51_010319 [Rhizopus arrhizus]KAG1444371.1 hypothetical protein G6F55_012346 [Rhizopus delemar]KAG1513668.1 hypothetical protein G6F53_004261 [Rhizopus delemar]KAG1524996.1 hypothetical protein G6F52_003719 [Rhizopus delemar]
MSITHWHQKRRVKKHSDTAAVYYDTISTLLRVKYEEGFVQIAPGHIITKPELLWTKADKDIIIPTDYSLCIGFSLQTQVNNERAKFMSSNEFKIYIAWTIVNIILFPVLQFNFSRNIYDFTYKEIMPQLVYGIELLIIAMLGVVSHFRFKRLLKNLKHEINGVFMTSRIQHYQDLNIVLSMTLFLFSISMVTLTADGLTQTKRLNQSKFYADFLICNVNVLMAAIWVPVILILHPKNGTRRSFALDS